MASSKMLHSIVKLLIMLMAHVINSLLIRPGQGVKTSSSVVTHCSPGVTHQCNHFNDTCLSDYLFLKQLFKTQGYSGSPMHMIYSEVVSLVQILLVIPAVNATNERTFLTLRRIKTYKKHRDCKQFRFEQGMKIVGVCLVNFKLTCA